MRLLVLVAALAPGLALAQTAAPLPEKHIPPTVVLELRTLENQFDQALAHDCAPERCVSKGCVYRDHVVVDLPRSSSLPGLGATEGLGSVSPQEYLTRAQCDFAHEKSVAPRDVQALAKRLEQRLSKGWLVVSVGRQLLEPISPALSEPPVVAPPPAPPERPAPPPLPPARWEWPVAARELWQTLLPHFAWMIALVLATAAALILIWAARRVGRESLEERALAARLAAQGMEGPPLEGRDAPAGEAGPSPKEGEATLSDGAATAALAEERRRWTERLAKADLSREGDGVAELLREWLRAGELRLLAKAIFVFGEGLTAAFPSDGELAGKKVELAEFLRDVDVATLPSDEDFFRVLSQHAVSAALLAQADTETLRSVREELGSAGLAQLVGRLPPRAGALLFALAPAELQAEVAGALSSAQRQRVGEHLLLSNRMSRQEQQFLFEALEAVRAGREMPPAPALDGLVDRGRTLDAAGALSVLLPQLAPGERRALLEAAWARANGAYPRWYEDIVYPDMLLRLPQEVTADLLLEVDARALAGWISIQDGAWQRDFIAGLPSALQGALRAGMSFASRREQQQLARRGREALATAIKRQLARGRVTFAELLG